MNLLDYSKREVSKSRISSLIMDSGTSPAVMPTWYFGFKSSHPIYMPSPRMKASEFRHLCLGPCSISFGSFRFATLSVFPYCRMFTCHLAKVYISECLHNYMIMNTCYALL